MATFVAYYLTYPLIASISAWVGSVEEDNPFHFHHRLYIYWSIRANESLLRRKLKAHTEQPGNLHNLLFRGKAGM